MYKSTGPTLPNVKVIRNQNSKLDDSLKVGNQTSKYKLQLENAIPTTALTYFGLNDVSGRYFVINFLFFNPH